MTTKKQLFLMALVLLTGFACSSSPKGEKSKIDHLIVMLFDQMRPDYIDRFDLPNFKKIRARSTNYENAYLGYMGSETVMTHLVIPTGLEPKNLPWQGDVFFDKHGWIGPSGLFYNTGALSKDQLFKLMDRIPEKNILHTGLQKNGSTFAVSPKDYAAYAFGTPQANSIVTIKKSDGKCVPVGKNVPKYISENDRYTLECSKKYGTEKTYYAYDGSRFVPGDDLAHQGGDIWIADIGLEIMKREKWSGLFLSFGAIDKIGHMLGEIDGERPPFTRNVKTDYPLSKILQIADAQLGRIIQELERTGMMDRTMIVITADHGAHTNRRYLGNGITAKWGKLENEALKENPKWTKHFAQNENVLVSLQDTATRTWLKSDAEADAKPVIKALSEVPGMVEIFKLAHENETWSYKKVFSRLEQEPKKFRKWAKEHNSEILDAMATENSPHLVGLMRDGYGFDQMGDHGGAQENVQRVPMILWIPGQAPAQVKTPFRTPNLKKEIEKTLGL